MGYFLIDSAFGFGILSPCWPVGHEAGSKPVIISAIRQVGWLVSQLVATMAQLRVLLLSLLLHQVTSVKLKSCSKRKPGKSTGGCSYTCNRRLGKWIEKPCRSNLELGGNKTTEETIYEEPRVCGLPLAPGLWWPEQECQGEERWEDYLGSCVSANHICADHVR